MGKKNRTATQEDEAVAETARLQAMEAVDKVMKGMTQEQRRAFYSTLLNTLLIEAEAEGVRVP